MLRVRGLNKLLVTITCIEDNVHVSRCDPCYQYTLKVETNTISNTFRDALSLGLLEPPKWNWSVLKTELAHIYFEKNEIFVGGE